MYAALEDGDCKAIASNGYKFCKQYIALEEFANKNDPEDTHTFRVRPKFHPLQHILDKACTGCNPKDEWAYKEETSGGIMRLVSRAIYSSHRLSKQEFKKPVRGCDKPKSFQQSNVQARKKGTA